ncbi:elongation factor P maturation arginine rhamnosyltransferase EarP [Kingella negevensis]|uniref:elongation factor P maturation arginine rhamnosyltransferase EarP n=1 Tax=Kingella negevensis TaxID=1522312 RepID=UPI00254E4814|nr:elongation factor P maturation arginine rhamnosyltransferase EarP [Kingella negevensis]MDK4680917.1 elongation factor P maturation arginine rhamnosyltransferase EarP [Kingella negevensis]MDK4683119.1 elongation factor P maturation arginine rhamnosyltransferase EarP [Kingella negevensis]MDK4691748.1 elongation factor P maturation arginine rhamnosyltransferase EarP [Kingella negevensis]MDK4693099.1 elongation factor P maturation arginine rhamnosyltransferase EarP [Kingella negevensis]MDK46994
MLNNINHSTLKPNTKKVCWLFCTVIDNYGDIGVSWRLAQELHNRLNWEVHLFLDDIAALQTILPDTPKTLPTTHRHIHIRDWCEALFANISQAPIPHIIIEAFACALPQSVHQIIQQHKPIWLNWEYLSAEDWAIRSHAMPSLQSNSSQKYFWQMGFVPQSGGLLREQNYPHTQPENIMQPETQIFAFGYQSPIWAEWAKVWANQATPITLRTAGEQIISSLKQQNIIPKDSQATEHQIGSLKIIKQSFVPQDQFDSLLQQNHINIIRGEDSFIRAQYAAQPFIWHIYPQEENAHLDKLDAYWQTYWQHVPPANFQAALTALSNELNNGETLSETQRSQHWATLFAQINQWRSSTQTWQRYLFEQSDTVTRLQEWLDKIIINSK